MSQIRIRQMNFRIRRDFKIRQSRDFFQDSGRWNQRKWTCFAILYSLKDRQEGRGGYATARELAELAGGSYGSLCVLLGRWLRWHYVRRRAVYQSNPRRTGTHPVYIYGLAPKGLKWLSGFAKWFLATERFKQEWQVYHHHQETLERVEPYPIKQTRQRAKSDAHDSLP